MKTATFSSLALVAATAAISMESSSALAPRTTTHSAPETASVTRRSAAMAVIGSAFAVATPAFAKEELTEEEKAYIEFQKEKMRKKIEASKKNYRTTNDLVKERKQTVNYTCLLDPSKCPDAKDEKK